MKNILKITTGLVLFLTIALPTFSNESISNRKLELKEKAKKLAENVYELKSYYENGRLIQGIVFIHFKEAGSHLKSRPQPLKLSSCYGFLSRDVRWRVTEPYYLDPNGSSMDAGYTVQIIETGLETWDKQVNFNIFGAGQIGTVDGADTKKPDGKNEILFADIADPGAVAVTIIWGYFYGSNATKQIIEYDMVFDSSEYNWGDATTNQDVMDFQNVATHEIGHAAGLADLYRSSCREETMYGYTFNGEITKRDLGPGDIIGIGKLYN